MHLPPVPIWVSVLSNMSGCIHSQTTVPFEGRPCLRDCGCRWRACRLAPTAACRSRACALAG